LAKDSVALCEQVWAISKNRLTKRVGRVSAEMMQAVERALRIAMDFTPPKNKKRPDLLERLSQPQISFF